MSEIQSPPASFSWDPATDAVSLTPKLNSTHVRLLSIKTYLKGSARKLAAIWIKEENPGWGWNPSISAADLKTTLGTDSRLVTLDAFWEKGAVKCAAAWIPKKNVFSNWSAQISAADLKAQLKKDDSRLTCLRSYVVDGQRTFSAIWIKKDIDWDWDPGIQFDALKTKLDNGAQRLVSLDAYIESGIVKFAAVWVKNTQFAFFWNAGLTQSVEKAQYDHFCAYPIDLVPIDVAAGTLASAMYQYPIPQQPIANILQASGNLAIKSVDDLGAEVSSGTLTVSNPTGATIDASQVTCYELTTGGAVLNAYPAFGPMWIFGPQSPLIASGGNVTSSIGPGPDICCSDLVVELVATNGADQQLSHVDIPFTRASFPAPPPVKAPTPLFFGVWTNPVEVIPLWNGKKSKWMTLAGNLTKRGDGPMLVTQLHLKIVAEKSKQTLIDQDLDLSKVAYYDAANNLVAAKMIDLAAQIQGSRPVFLYGMPLDVEFPDGEMTLWLNYKLIGLCGSATISMPVKNIAPVTLNPPVSGTWFFNNSPNHTSFDPHASVHQRYSIDLLMRDPVTLSHLKDPTKSADLPDNYLCWGQTIYCMAHGFVRSVVDSNLNSAHAGDSGDPNYVIVDHDTAGWSSGYFHIQHSSAKVTKGQEVFEGTPLAVVGNVGFTSEPHLHLEFRTDGDPVGRSNHLPMQFKKLFVSSGGSAVVGVPATSDYFVMI